MKRAFWCAFIRINDSIRTCLESVVGGFELVIVKRLACTIAARKETYEAWKRWINMGNYSRQMHKCLFRFRELVWCRGHSARPNRVVEIRRNLPLGELVDLVCELVDLLCFRSNLLRNRRLQTRSLLRLCVTSWTSAPAPATCSRARPATFD